MQYTPRLLMEFPVFGQPHMYIVMINEEENEDEEL